MIQFLLRRLTTLLTPPALLLLATRLLLTPCFLELEYRLPDFPADTFGFTQTERLHYSKLALQYLLAEQDISFLAKLQFADGSPLYTDRELRHMEDVQHLVRGASAAGYTVWGILIILGIVAWQKKQWHVYRQGLSHGGRLTVGMVIILALGAILSFDLFFTWFHALFFEGDSWLFYYSDTLIRLFPMRFWQDAFLLGGLLTAGGGAILILLGQSQTKKTNSPPEPAS